MHKCLILGKVNYVRHKSAGSCSFKKVKTKQITHQQPASQAKKKRLIISTHATQENEKDCNMEETHRFVFMDKAKLRSLISELQLIGCCSICVLRYLGITDPTLYRNKERIQNVLCQTIPMTIDADDGHDMDLLKQRKPNTCVACLGLLQDGLEDQWLSKIALEVLETGIEAVSYCPAITLPIAIQIRAYSIWFHLKNKFGDFLSPIHDLKPDGVSIKATWKWITSQELKDKVDPKSFWGVEGTVAVQIDTSYEDDDIECQPMRAYIQKNGKNKKGTMGNSSVSRSSVEAILKSIDYDIFSLHFQCPPSIPTKSICLESVRCNHEPIYVAGRYCKYSREVSQTPWILDNKVRKAEDSVEELMTKHIITFLGASESKFCTSGREDVDVRMLGIGRPFVFEVINPKRTIFTRERMLMLQNQINSSTPLISVRDIQIVDKKDVNVLKTGEESKSKMYCALCILPGHSVTEDHLKLLNGYSMPITLKQKTPVRVLHRRSLATRERRILEMKAVAVPDEPEMFKLFVRTDAGTYVKEFVHGDFGRTLPNISTILAVEADILTLDVTEVALDWPPALD